MQTSTLGCVRLESSRAPATWRSMEATWRSMEATWRSMEAKRSHSVSVGTMIQTKIARPRHHVIPPRIPLAPKCSTHATPTQITNQATSQSHGRGAASPYNLLAIGPRCPTKLLLKCGHKRLRNSFRPFVMDGDFPLYLNPFKCLWVWQGVAHCAIDFPRRPFTVSASAPLQFECFHSPAAPTCA